MDRKETESVLDEIFDYYKTLKGRGDQDNLVTMLREIQEVCGAISPELQKRAADTAGVKLSVITAIMRLYKSLRETEYRHRLVVCTGPRCAERNSGLLSFIRKELQINEEGYSPDGTVLLETRNCLKQCRSAPNIMLDGELYPHMTEEKVLELIRNLT